MIIKFKLFENKQTIFLGKYVWNYFLKYGSENHSQDENPMFYYKEQILNNKYILKSILISDLIENDNDLKEFIDSENEYKDDYKINRIVENNIIIGNSNFAKDVVIDGYHRIFQSIINGKKEINAFIPLNSKFNI